MVKRALVTTTIHDLTGFHAWTDQLDPASDIVIIVGDMKTPDDRVAKNIRKFWSGQKRILMPDGTDFLSEATLGVDTIQRRNIGILAAIQAECDYMLTVDDDNFPTMSNHIKHLDRFMLQTGHGYTYDDNSSKWWNPGDLCDPQVSHRGMPLSKRHITEEIRGSRVDNGRIGVFSSLWIGDPDIDAVERIANDPRVITATSGGPDFGVMAPFNSQATAIRGELLPAYMMVPFIGRYDDIWASYILRHVMDHLFHHVWYGKPLVRQTRNEHNLVHDLRDEMFGYEHTEPFIEILTSIDLAGMSTAFECITVIFHEFQRHSLFPYKTKQAMLAWLDDVEEALK
jgi:reversibly glycosylated polypeptide